MTKQISHLKKMFLQEMGDCLKSQIELKLEQVIDKDAEILRFFL